MNRIEQIKLAFYFPKKYFIIVPFLFLGLLTLGSSYAQEVTTKAITNITANSANSGADVSVAAGVNIIEQGIVYGLSANPTIADHKIVATSKVNGSFNSLITGLSPVITYYVRAYVIKTNGTVYGNEVVFTTLAPDENSVIVEDKGATVVLRNAIVKATINKSNATVISMIYNGIELISGGYNGGSIYWSWNMPNYQNPSGCTYTLTSDPHKNNFDQAEIKLHMTWNGSPSTAAMDVDVYYTLLRNTSGIYATATLTHPTSYPANPGGEWRMSSYPNPIFNWLSVDSLRNRNMATNASGNPVAVSGAPLEVTRFTTGIYAGQYECKYDYSADFGDINVWGWSSTAKNVGIWVTAPSKEYYPGGPMKRELMCHLTPVMLNMLGGTHYNGGGETAIAAGEDWQKTYGPFLIYCNKLPAGTANINMALWNDAKAKALSEQALWPYNWSTNPTYIKESSRGSVTGKLIIDDLGIQSAANMWVGLAIPPTGSASSTDFQNWSKNYQFWVKTDKSGNFTIPHVLPGNYSLFAFGSAAAGQLSLTNYATVVANKTTILGDVIWKPNRIAPTVWEIGIPDRNAMEYKHGLDWWTSNTYPNLHWAKFMDYVDEFPNDVNFTIGKSKFATDWNFVQPYDKSVQSTSPNWKINFNLPNAPTGANASVYVALAANFGSALILSVNGTSVTFPITGVSPGNSSNAKIRKGIHGAFSEVRFTFPASYLKAGNNQLSFTIRVTGGATTGEVMYDYVRLEADGFKPWPISLVDFTVAAENKSALVNWNTSSEQNNSHFILSHSTDGTNFTFLSKFQAALNGDINNSYTYSHLSPINGAF